MSNWQHERLVKEWTKHGKLIIACDFDDTLRPYSLTDEANVSRMHDTLKLLKRCQKVGAHVIIFTSRREECIGEIRDWCAAMRLPIYGINTNVDGIPFGNNQKPYANIYLDDRAGVEEATATLLSAVQDMEANGGANKTF